MWRVFKSKPRASEELREYSFRGRCQYSNNGHVIILQLGVWLSALCQSQVDKHILTRQSGTEQSRGRVASALSSLTLMSFWQMEVQPKLVWYERFHICLLAGLLPPVFIGNTESIYSAASCFVHVLLQELSFSHFHFQHTSNPIRVNRATLNKSAQHISTKCQPAAKTWGERHSANPTSVIPAF